MRWMLLAVSIGSFVMGISVKIRNPVLPSEPLEVTAAEAIEKLDQWKTYVSLSAGIDLDSRVYSTDVASPVYALKSTNEVHPLAATHAALKDYLGTTVRVSSRIESGGIQMQMIENTVGEDKVMSQRQLSPLAESNGEVWVLTNRRVGNQGDQSLNEASVFEGVLTRFVDFDKNLQSYIEGYSLEKIQKLLSKEQQFEITGETYLIISGLENTKKNPFYCAVKGSDNLLYAAMTEKLVAAPPYPLVGIMERWEAEAEGSLGSLLNTNPPARIGVIRHGWTADMYNKRSADSVKGTFLFAVIFLFLAAFIFLKSRRQKKK
ncbi:MAG: hypothetical protein GXP30_06965 [Verrucomicrobia bacterium]|nr:hypothetical protein [Verrucomicrobiota bacterium]